MTIYAPLSPASRAALAVVGSVALASTATIAVAQQRQGGTVRLAIAEESRGLDPLTAHRRFSEAAIHVHDSLWLYNADNKPFPSLATEWSSNADSTEYTSSFVRTSPFMTGQNSMRSR